jgi:hypothetical protein
MNIKPRYDFSDIIDSMTIRFDWIGSHSVFHTVQNACSIDSPLLIPCCFLYSFQEDEVLGRIKASVDDPLALETAGYALYDLYAERRGNLFSDEVYRLTKAKDATTTYARSIQDDFSADSISSTARYLPANHKFSRNDVIMLTLQPNGSGDFFDPITTLPTSDKAVVTEARVLNMGPTYVDIAMPAGCFESTFGPAPNDASGSGDKRMRLRADRFFSDVPYRRMVEALTQITAIPDNQAATAKKASNTISTATESEKKKAETKNKNPHENIVMDEVLREAILSTHAFTDIHSPLLRDPDVCDLEQVSNKLAKPPMETSYKLASQAVKYMKSNPHGVFRTFNAPQLASIEAALTRRMTMIQGPPGSGECISAILLYFFHNNFCIPHTHLSPYIHSHSQARRQLPRQSVLALSTSVEQSRPAPRCWRVPLATWARTIWQKP